MSSNLYDLTGRVAIITGGGTGIGAATARVLASFGTDLVIASRTAENLERTSKAIETDTGRRCVPVPTDVKDEEQVVHMVQRAVDDFGHIDILVNNAGGTRLGPLTQLPTKAWDASFALNVRAAYLCTREAGRYFLAQGSGAIVNVSSGAGVHGVRGGAHYSSAKAALQMFTTVTAAEWGPHGVRANCVAVGLVDSERRIESWRIAKRNPDIASSSIPLRRPGTPEEVAHAIHFLASDAASYITGQTLSVNGGPNIRGMSDT
jgi:NAD(P)-dependent dehydrogenase (short-subunit alcohol dehydrogenase family)